MNIGVKIDGGPIKWHYPHPSVRAWLMLHCRWHIIKNKSPRPLPGNDLCAANVSRLLTNTPWSWTVFRVSWCFCCTQQAEPKYWPLRVVQKLEYKQTHKPTSGWTVLPNILSPLLCGRKWSTANARLTANDPWLLVWLWEHFTDEQTDWQESSLKTALCTTIVSFPLELWMLKTTLCTTTSSVKSYSGGACNMEFRWFTRPGSSLTRYRIF